MGRSRSLFDDLDTAIATAASLSAADESRSSSSFTSPEPLVSFHQPSLAPEPERPNAAGAASAAVAEPVAAVATGAVAAVGPVPTLRADALSPSSETVSGLTLDGSYAAQLGKGGIANGSANGSEEGGGEKKLPPKLPDLSTIASPVHRCEKIVSWIAEATGATDVFLVDSAGYALAGAIKGVEARLAGVGLVAASVSSLAASVPGNASPLFELHIGEGPFFQVIGFQAGATVYVVGFMRTTPLTPRQSHAIRLACRHALGDTLRGALWESE